MKCTLKRKGKYLSSLSNNRHTKTSNQEGTKKGIIKLKPHLLLNALKSLTSPMAKESLVAYALERIGYSVVQQSDPLVSRFDLVVEKNNRWYAIEIKGYVGPYVHPEQLRSFLSNSKEILPGAERVLFIDTSKVTKDVR